MQKRTKLLILIAFGLVLLRFFPFLFGKTLIFGDNFSLMIPGKLFSAQWLSRGVVPFWNPNLFAGISWIGDINQSMFYPTTLLFMWFSPSVALNISQIFHQTLAFIGVALLARKFVKPLGLQIMAGALWTFNPLMTVSLHNLSTQQTPAWMPWVVWAGTKHPLWFITLCFIQMAAGYPQHVLYSVISAVFLQWWLAFQEKDFTWWKWIRKWVFIGVVTIAVTAVFWLPMMEDLQNSTRSIQTAQQANSGSMVVSDFMKFVFPTIFDYGRIGMKWGPSWSKPPIAIFYVPMISLIAFFFVVKQKKWQKNDWFFAAAIGAPILIALLASYPQFNVLYSLPIVSMSRGITTLLIISAIFWAIWATTLVDRARFYFPKNAALIVIALIVLASLSYLISSQKEAFTVLWQQVDSLTGSKLSLSPFHTVVRDQIIAVNFFLFVLIQLGVLLASWWLLKKKRLLLFGIVLGLEAIIVSTGHYMFAPGALYSIPAKSQSVEQLLEGIDLQQYRVLPRNYNAPYTDFGMYYDALLTRAPFSDSFIDKNELRDFNSLKRMKGGGTPNWNIQLGIPIITGYATLVPKDIDEEFNSTEIPGLNDLPEISPVDPKLAQWAVKYYLVDTAFDVSRDPIAGAQQQPLRESGPWKLYELPALPRFRYLDGGAVTVGDLKENPNEISFRAINDTAQTEMIIADRWDKNWRAEVNGESVTVENLNGMRKISLPSGYNEVRMWFYPERFYLGVKISLLTAALLVLWYGRITLRLFSSRT